MLSYGYDSSATYCGQSSTAGFRLLETLYNYLKNRYLAGWLGRNARCEKKKSSSGLNVTSLPRCIYCDIRSRSLRSWGGMIDCRANDTRIRPWYSA